MATRIALGKAGQNWRAVVDVPDAAPAICIRQIRRMPFPFRSLWKFKIGMSNCEQISHCQRGNLAHSRENFAQSPTVEYKKRVENDGEKE